MTTVHMLFAPLHSQKKDIFKLNKRLKNCNPAIVSLCLNFSIDCFDETGLSNEP